MAITSKWYSLGLAGQFGSAPVNWTADTIKVGLVTASYTPAQDTDQFWTTPVANEITGTGYTAGGATLAGKSVGAVIATHTVPLIASASSWTTASFTCRYAVVYKSTGTNGTSPLLGWVDFGSNETVASGTFAINWDAVQGVLQLTAS